MYEFIYDKPIGKIGGIKRLSDNASIPLCEANSDYQEFLKWNKAQKVPLDLNSSIPVVPPVPVRDLAKELDALKIRIGKAGW